MTIQKMLKHWRLTLVGNGQCRKPWLLDFRSSKAFVTFVVSFSIFADQFIFAVIVPVMPFTLHDQVGVPEDSVQYWVSVLLAVYGAATTATSPLWGWYADRYNSRRVPFLLGLVVIATATIIIWQTHEIALQVIGRLLQGLAAAIVWVTGLAMIADNVGEGEIGQYVGYLGIAMMLGTLIGPLLGGVVLAKAGFNAVYIMTVGMIGFDIVLRLLVVERSVASKWIETKQDVGTSQETIVQETKDSTIQLQKAGWNAKLPAVIRLLSSRRLCVALWASFAIGTVFAGFETVLPLHTQEAFGWNSLGAGLIFIPLTLPAFLGPVVGWLSDRYGPKWLMVIGFIALCPILTLLRFVYYDSLGQKAILCVLLALSACCFTLTLDPVMAEVAYVLADKARHNPTAYSGASNKAYAQAFGLFNTAYSLGNTIGPICAGLIKDVAGWDTMGWVLGLLAGLTAIPVLFWSGQRKSLTSISGQAD